jgi:DAK2 domain fusion protein YloV
LEVLRDAGVVDAGGQGYFTILEGMLRWAKGQSLELAVPLEAPTDTAAATAAAAGPGDLGHEGFGFCTNVLLRGSAMPFEQVRDHINGAGESVVVVGDPSIIRVHVHTERPGDILNYLGGVGILETIEIFNMDMQREELLRRRAASQPVPPPAAVRFRSGDALHSVGSVAVAPGTGFSDLFFSLNADAVVTGGQTMNPSTNDLLEAIEGVAQTQVVVLPNNGNILGAAQQAAHLSSKQVIVVPTRTLPQGVAAMLGRNFTLGFEAYAQAMGRASQKVLTAEITTAVRDATVDGVAVLAGQTIGLLDDTLVAAGDNRDAVIDQTLEQMGLDEREVLTIYYGQSASETDASALAARLGERYPGPEVDVRPGGQPFYDFIISAE